MGANRNTTREELRQAAVPEQLIDEATRFATLGLDRPMPTDELVAETMQKLRETLSSLPLPIREPVVELAPAVVSPTPQPMPWPQFLGTLSASVLGEALPFATTNPGESAIVVVDNHGVVDPEAWDMDPQLTMLRGTYRTAQEVLERVQALPICRIVVLKDSTGAYDDCDLAVIRRAIARPTAKCTYLVSKRRAGALKDRSCTIVGREMMFELSSGTRVGGRVVAGPTGMRDVDRVTTVREAVAELQSSAVAVYVDGQLNARFEWALQSESNDRLRAVLGEMIG